MNLDRTKSATAKARPAQSLTAILAISLFGLSAVTLLVSGSLQIFFNIQARQAAIFDKEQLIAQGAAKTVTNFLEEKFAVLSTLGWQVNPNLASVSAQNQMLTSVLTRQPDFNQLIIFDAQNHETARASRSQIHTEAIYERFASLITADVLTQTKIGQRYISAVYYDEYTGAPLVTLVVPMTDALGNFQGTLAVELNLISTWRPVRELKVGETGYVYVVDSLGKLIASKDFNRVLTSVNGISKVKEFLNNPSASPANTTFAVAPYSGLNDEQVLGTYEPLGTPQWAVIVEIPTAEAYQPIIQSLIVSIFTILALAVLVGLTGILMARLLTAPLVDLSNVATEIASGNLSIEAKVKGPAEIARLSETFNSMTFRLRENLSNLEKRVADRTSEITIANQKIERRAKQFASISAISHIINQTQNLPDLLPEIVRAISEEFNFYHTGIFLLDANKEYAVLRAANSEGGQKMLDRNHKLLVGQTGIVGYTSGSGKPRIALDTGSDSVYFNNPDLPNTRSEMALPLLKTGGEIIGVLDVQSTIPNAFTQEDIEVLAALADQVAVAISNVSLYEDTQKALIEGDLVYRQNLRTDWEKYTRSSNLVGIQRKGLQSNLLTEPIEISGTEPGQHMDLTKLQNHTNIPISLRGAKIGMLSIENNNNRQFTQDELDVIAAILERAALAMENARLLEESQRRAAREQTISEISAKIVSGTEIEAILQTAVRELGAQIGGTQISVEIGGEYE